MFKDNISLTACQSLYLFSRVWGRHAPTRKLSHGAGNFQELKICDHGTVLALTPLGKGVFMDIEVKRMSPTAVEMLDQLSAVCKRFGVDYYAASRSASVSWFEAL